jgi:hypothetical protein
VDRRPTPASATNAALIERVFPHDGEPRTPRALRRVDTIATPAAHGRSKPGPRLSTSRASRPTEGPARSRRGGSRRATGEPRRRQSGDRRGGHRLTSDQPPGRKSRRRGPRPMMTPGVSLPPGRAASAETITSSRYGRPARPSHRPARSPARPSAGAAGRRVRARRRAARASSSSSRRRRAPSPGPHAWKSGRSSRCCGTRRAVGPYATGGVNPRAT